tara:strand:- start:2618 stop:3004 length:387 start_codon:yes stop_codon:yes gene_type:complete
MKITKNWTTKIGKMQLNTPEDIKIKLMELIVNKAVLDPTFDFVKEYEKIANEVIRYYLTNAYNITDAKSLNIEATVSGHYQVNGERTHPHYHPSFDGVFVHYLTAGDEYVLKDGKVQQIQQVKNDTPV